MNYGLAKKVLVICAALVTLNPVLGDEFKNSVVNVKFSHDSSGSLKVNVVTAKPYSMPVLVNKKDDNKYVILLPETDNTMSGCPKIDNVSGIVNGISVKTQPYVSGGCKGYTKITITSHHPVNITATSSVPVTAAALTPAKPVQPAVVKPAPTQPVKTAAVPAKPAAAPAAKPVTPAVKPVPAQTAPVKPVIKQEKPAVKIA